MADRLARMAPRGAPIMSEFDNDEADVAVMEPQGLRHN